MFFDTALEIVRVIGIAIIEDIRIVIVIVVRFELLS